MGCIRTFSRPILSVPSRKKAPLHRLPTHPRAGVERARKVSQRKTESYDSDSLCSIALLSVYIRVKQGKPPPEARKHYSCQMDNGYSYGYRPWTRLSRQIIHGCIPKSCMLP